MIEAAHVLLRQLVALAHLGPIAEQAYGIGDQVSEVARSRLPEAALVRAVQCRQLTQPRRARGLGQECELGGVHPVLLEQRHESQGVLGEGVRSGDSAEPAQLAGLQARQGLAHGDRLLEAAQHQADGLGTVVAQQARAEAVEGVDPGLPVGVGQASFQVEPAGDLAGRSRGEGEHQDLVAAGQAAADYLGVEPYQRPGLAGPRAGKQPQRAVEGFSVQRCAHADRTIVLDVPRRKQWGLLRRDPLIRVIRGERSWASAAP